MNAEIEQVIADVPCVGCGFNLRTLDAEGRCPECGARVRWTLEETAMRWGTGHLRRLAENAVWVAATALALPAALVGGEFLQRVVRPWLAAPSDARGMWAQAQTAFLLGMTPFLVTLVLHVTAVWRAAGAPAGGRLNRHQVLMRVGAVMFLGAAAELLLQTLVLFWGYGGNVPGLACSLPALLLGLALYPLQGAEYLSDISRRAGQREKAGWALWGLWLFSGGVVLLDGELLLSFVSIGRRSAAALECLVLPLGVGGGGLALLGLVGSTIALFRFSGRMRALAREAPVAGAALTAVVRGAKGDEEAVDDVRGNPWLK